MASGDYISGESISRSLGISRTAVWKRIEALKREGYSIEASTRKGYRIISREAQYGRHGIQSLLETGFIGRELKFLNKTDSTNTSLKALASGGAPDGTVAVADEQTSGRGRLGRAWASSSGLGIWMSVLLRPKLHPTTVQSITPAIAVAVCRALEPLLFMKPGIKWPNDVLVDGRKICGILTELSAEADMISWVISGIGINVNHEERDFPQDLRGRAASVKMYLKPGTELSRCRLAADVLNRLEEVYLDYLENGPGPVLAEWKERSVTLGRKVLLIQGGTETAATALDLGEDGRLIVRLEDGTLKDVISGEISLRNLDC